MISKDIDCLFNTLQIAHFYLDKVNNIKKTNDRLNSYFYSNPSLKPFLTNDLIGSVERMKNVEQKIDDRWYQIKRADFGRECYLFFIEDITENKSTIENLNNALVRLSPLVVKDKMTQLYHKEFFYKKLSSLLRSENEFKSSLVFIDIDFFKKYNDKYGHVLGDDCLNKVASIIKGSTRSMDIVARFGGEEFIILLNNTLQSEANDITSRILSSVEGLNIKHELSPFGIVTISAGVFAFNNKESYSAQDLINEADSLLYLSKNSGRNKLTPRH